MHRRTPGRTGGEADVKVTGLLKTAQDGQADIPVTETEDEEVQT